MTLAEEVRRVADPLPRSGEHFVRGRWKYRVGAIVYVAFSADEEAMGFGYPKEARQGLIASAPETFFLPRESDLRFNWVCARLAPLETTEMRELVLDAWRMCTPKLVHDLPDLPAQAMAAWSALDEGDVAAALDLLDADCEWHDGRRSLRGLTEIAAYLRDAPTPRPPRAIEVRDELIAKWVR